MRHPVRYALAALRDPIERGAVRILSWPKNVFLTDLEGFGGAVGSFVLYLLSVAVDLITLGIAATSSGAPEQRTLSLSVALVLITLSSAGDLVEYATAVSDSDDVRRERALRVGPPWYPTAVIVMLIISFSLLFLLLNDSDHERLTFITNASMLLALLYTPRTISKYWALVSVVRRDDPLFEGYVDYIAIMLQYLGKSPSAMASKLRQMETLSHVETGKRDEEVYKRVWDEFVIRKLNELHEQGGGHVTCPNEDEAKQRVRFAYCCLNLHCSENYMEMPSKPLDRHKVAACYTLAIVAAAPLVVDDAVPSSDPRFFSNERLAVTVGCSVLRSFIDHWLEELLEGNSSLGNLNHEQRLITIKSRDRINSKGLRIPQNVGHGEKYLQSAYIGLRYTNAERNFNPLAAGTFLLRPRRAFAKPRSSQAHVESMQGQERPWGGNRR